MTSQVAVGSTTLTNAQWAVVEARVEAVWKERARTNPSAGTRFHYRERDVRVTIKHPGGTTTQHKVTACDLSERSTSFLGGGFLYPGMGCAVFLPNLASACRGKVAWCEYMAGIGHVTGVLFETPIEPMQLLDTEDWATQIAQATPEPGPLTGHILYLDDQEMDQDLLKFQLQQAGLTVVSAASPDEAIRAAATTPPNLVLCDLNLGAVSGETAIARLRGNGYNGPVVALTAESDPERLRQARAAGACAVVQKPCDPKRLVPLLAVLLRTARNDAGPIYSQNEKQAAMAPLIARFVERAKASADDLDRLTAANDLEAVRLACQSLKGSGAGYGFPAISQTAGLAIQALSAAKSVHEALQPVRNLQQLCRRASVRAA